MGKWSLFREHRELEKGTEIIEGSFFDNNIFDFKKAIKSLKDGGGEKVKSTIIVDLQNYLSTYNNSLFPETVAYVQQLKSGIDNFSKLVNNNNNNNEKTLIKALKQMDELDVFYKAQMRKAA